MAITAQMVKELRDKTGAGMMDCKKALTESNGDMEKAIDFLREKGLSKAAKKSSRLAAEGLVSVRVSDDMKRGVIVEVNSETDFVTKNDEFKNFVNEVTNIALEKDIKSLDDLLKAEMNSHTVQDELTDKIAKIGENLNVRRVENLSVDNGIIVSYLHGAGNIGTLVKVESESSDKNSLEELGKDMAMQIAAMSPKFLKREDVDDEYIEHEREVLKVQALNENDELEENKRKPKEIVIKMVEGRLNKELKEVCLLEQAFVKEPKKSVKEVCSEYSKKLSTDCKITKYVRFEVGEGMEKKEEDFAEEVAKQMGN